MAAGASTRLGVPKQLSCLPHSPHETLLERTLRIAIEAAAHPVFVVLGANRNEIERTVRLQNCTVLQNPDWAEGMASSLRVGISAVAEQLPHAQGALLLVCDQPALSAEHLRRLIAAHRANPDCAVASKYSGRVAVPAIVPRSAFPALRALTGDQGARAILKLPELRVVEIEFPDGEWDIDLPNDLERFRERR
jgi:molybdenum cofactor cytidylyltransferase